MKLFFLTQLAAGSSTQSLTSRSLSTCRSDKRSRQGPTSNLQPIDLKSMPATFDFSFCVLNYQVPGAFESMWLFLTCRFLMTSEGKTGNELKEELIKANSNMVLHPLTPFAPPALPENSRTGFRAA